MELRWGYLILYLLAVPLYVLLTISAPTDALTQRYQLSSTSILLLQFSVVIPMVLIWLAALKGISALKEYTTSLRDKKERPGMQFLLRGLQLLVLGLIVTTLFGALRAYFREEDFYPAYQIFNNYLRILFSLVGVYYIYLGSRKLLDNCDVKRIPNSHQTKIVFITLAVTVVSGLLVYHNPARNTTADPQIASFYMNDLLIGLTILLPNFLTWLFGSLAALQVKKYSDQLRHRGFREGFAKLAGSVIAIIVISIALQMLVSFSVALSTLSLGALLLVVYLLLFGYAVAYMLLASSARKLRETSEA